MPGTRCCPGSSSCPKAASWWRRDSARLRAATSGQRGAGPPDRPASVDDPSVGTAVIRGCWRRCGAWRQPGGPGCLPVQHPGARAAAGHHGHHTAPGLLLAVLLSHGVSVLPSGAGGGPGWAAGGGGWRLWGARRPLEVAWARTPSTRCRRSSTSGTVRSARRRTSPRRPRWTRFSRRYGNSLGASLTIAVRFRTRCRTVRSR